MVFLLENFLGHISLNADIVRVIASFNSHILLILPLEQATFYFATIYQIFSLRGWLGGSSENDCRDEYLEFVGHSSQMYPSLKNSPAGFTDIVDILSALLELRNRLHLYRLFRISCMCLTEDNPLLPPFSSKMLIHIGRETYYYQHSSIRLEFQTPFQFVLTRVHCLDFVS